MDGISIKDIFFERPEEIRIRRAISANARK
jgi:hypothetical protein